MTVAAVVVAAYLTLGAISGWLAWGIRQRVKDIVVVTFGWLWILGIVFAREYMEHRRLKRKKVQS